MLMTVGLEFLPGWLSKIKSLEDDHVIRTDDMFVRAFHLMALGMKLTWERCFTRVWKRIRCRSKGKSSGNRAASFCKCLQKLYYSGKRIKMVASCAVSFCRVDRCGLWSWWAIGLGYLDYLSITASVSVSSQDLASVEHYKCDCITV